MSEEVKKKEKKSGNPGQILANIYQRIHAELSIRPERFLQIMDRYTRKINVGKELSTNALSTARGNLRKELFKDSLSWRVFLKGLHVLAVSRVDIRITLHHSNKRQTVHDTSIQLSDDESEVVELDLEDEESSDDTSSTK